MDPHFQQAPPQYSQLPQRMQMQPPPSPVEVNKLGPTIQHSVIQCLVHQGMQSGTITNKNPVQSSMMPQTGATSSQGHSNGNTASDPERNRRDRLLEHDPTNTDYVVNCMHENRPMSLNDIARPVFVNHYYARLFQEMIKAQDKMLLGKTNKTAAPMSAQKTSHQRSQ